MAEIDPALRQILSDDERLGQVLELARMLRGSGAKADLAPTRAPEPEPESPPEPPAHLAGPMPALMEAIPLLLGAFSGSVDNLPPEKVRLLEALRPYASGMEDSFNRALRVAGIARAAQAALERLGAEQP